MRSEVLMRRKRIVPFHLSYDELHATIENIEVSPINTSSSFFFWTWRGL